MIKKFLQKIFKVISYFVFSAIYGTIKQSVHPAIIDNEHLNTKKAAPKLSEDTDEVLKELGYLKTDIEKLRNGRVIL